MLKEMLSHVGEDSSLGRHAREYLKMSEDEGVAWAKNNPDWTEKSKGYRKGGRVIRSIDGKAIKGLTKGSRRR